MQPNRRVNHGYPCSDSSEISFIELTNAISVRQFCLCLNLKVQDDEVIANIKKIIYLYKNTTVQILYCMLDFKCFWAAYFQMTLANNTTM